MSYWLPVVVVLGVVLIVALALIVRRTQTLPADAPLEQDPNDFAAPQSLEMVHAQDELTARELEEERAQDTTPAA